MTKQAQKLPKGDGRATFSEVRNSIDYWRRSGSIIADAIPEGRGGQPQKKSPQEEREAVRKSETVCT